MKYTYARKRNLIKRINEIDDKCYLIDIFNIISIDNPEVTETDDGISIVFDSLSDETYAKISSYVTKYKKNMKDIEKKNNHDYNDHLKNISVNNMFQPKLRYSNNEKSVLKRRQYVQELNNECEYQEFDIGLLSSDNKKNEK